MKSIHLPSNCQAAVVTVISSVCLINSQVLHKHAQLTAKQHTTGICDQDSDVSKWYLTKIVLGVPSEGTEYTPGKHGLGQQQFRSVITIIQISVH